MSKKTNYPPLYTSWIGMMQRCNYKRSKAYADYGGRGIKVCDSWKTFGNYQAWILDNLGDKPSHKHTLDRTNNDGDYEPGNVRWATRLQQVHNRRLFKNNHSGYRGVSWHKGVKKWVAQIRIEGKKKHIGYYETPEMAHEVYKTVFKTLVEGDNL
jgi:hypothetical protein